MKNIRKEKGITLIALVITIIVLLILVGVAITSITGENGILLRAKDAKEKTGDASNNETDMLEKYNEYINKYTENGSTGEEETPSEGGTSNGISLAENANVGDIISNYQAGDYTGDWLVLSNDGTTVNIITKDVIENVFTAEKMETWDDGLESQLEELCPKYLNTTYGQSARSVNIDDISIDRTGSVYDFSDWPEPSYFNDNDCGHYWNSKKIYINVSHHCYYDDDYIGAILNLAKNGFKESILNTTNSYFLDLRDDNGDSYYCITNNGEILTGSCGNKIYLNDYMQDYTNVDIPFGLRPVVTLKTGIKGTKDGTTWTLE